jgi:hypothetical protein
MSSTASFLKAFDPSNESHIKWFKKMTDLAETMADPNQAANLDVEINSNPMKVKLAKQDTLDWFHIHFVLCAAYAKAVLKGKAWIP